MSRDGTEAACIGWVCQLGFQVRESRTSVVPEWIDKYLLTWNLCTDLVYILLRLQTIVRSHFGSSVNTLGSRSVLMSTTQK